MQNFCRQIRCIMWNVEVAYSTRRDFLLFIRHLHIFTLGFAVVPRESKDCFCKTRSFMEDVKMPNSPFYPFSLFYCLRKGQIWHEFIKGLAKIKTGWKKRHVDNRGSYENDIFCEIGEFGKDSSKVWQKIKWGLLAVGDFHENGKLKELRKSKSWKMAIIRKWQILGEKGKFRQKWRVLPNKRVWPNIQIRWQKGASWQMAILRKFQIWQEFIGLAKIKTW